MIARVLTTGAGLACLGTAAWLAPPTPAALREWSQRLVRPAALPFAFRDLEDAVRRGTADETFTRARRILQLLPGWTDGHVVFAYRYALALDPAVPAARRGDLALERVHTALAWLEAARAEAGRREVALLQAMAFLPVVAANQVPELEERLRAEGGPIAIEDRYLAEAERLEPGPFVREQRMFLAPAVAAGMLAAGDRTGALAVLAAAIARAGDARDRALATEWARRLDECRRCLRGEPVDLTAVRADARMVPLLPYLR